ncbi:unnamed protein product [Dracunculus medinensis]|uniref:receptor protein-tyrosine kinase n=1 Tax=Dracunculus medinensis TaxID=318479 RepID=A0A158Q5V1_DRAME|nr:unnamed protein product [Dracunculus medinensis]
MKYFQISTEKEVYCRSLDIRNSPIMAFQDKENNQKWSTLSECTVMEGDFSVSMITSSNFTHESFPVFKRLRVITGHLLIFQVSALRSLKDMFPNLRIIGGQELIMNYALVIYQNTHMIEVGLPKLTTIFNGGVRIVDNTQLCYSRYIDWGAMLVGSANDILIDQSKSTDSELCNDICEPENDERCHRVDGMLSCWDTKTCQLKCHHSRNDDQSIGPGCDDLGRRCHDQCLGGCSLPNNPSKCHFCKNVDYNGTCFDHCPESLYEIHHVYLVRRCVTLEECRSISAPVTPESTRKQMLVVDNMCRVDCPFGQEIDPTNSSRCIKCEGYCPVKCKGGTIDSFGRMQDYLFKKCNVIEGFLEIELRTGLDAGAIEKVGEALGNIEVIEGYLLIDFSTSFISLHMFKRLRLIKGNTLWRDRYALAIFENPNLRQVFDFERQPISISNGTVLFQNNRMLCYNRIKSLIDHMGLTDVKENDVSYYSNGDRAICNETTFEVKTDEVHSFGFMISWVAFNTTDMDHRKFLGYQVFFKKVDGPDPNLTIDDNRSACSDSWQMHFEPEKGNGNEGLNRGTALFGVESNTWYAYYVQTKLINHPGARNAISKINFVKTLFSPPDPPEDVRGKSMKSDQIDLEWDPPEKANGDITHYSIRWQLLTDDSSSFAGHVCDDKAGAGRRQHKDPQRTIQPVTSKPSAQTCLKQEGCCDCRSLKRTGLAAPYLNEEEETNDEAEFENAVQNHVFIQQLVYFRIFFSKLIEISESHLSFKSFLYHYSDTSQRLTRDKRNVQLNTMTNDKIYGDEKKIRIIHEVNESISLYKVDKDIGTHRINVTTRFLRILGLRHYTQYQVWLYACQNTSAEGGSYCSQRPGWIVIRTAPIPENDLVDNSTIEVINSTTVEEDRRSRKIVWAEPLRPNGAILAYKVKVVAEDREQTPIPQCIKASDFRRDGGVTFRGLPEGIYRVEVRTISVASLALVSTDEIAVARTVFSVVKPSFFTWKVTLLIIMITFLVLSIAALLLYYFSQKVFGEKVREYVRQQISANPEYLSQMDVYKPDEWELKRTDIVLEEEIGRGTFGKVYRGCANNVISHGGVRFGECAVKTVAEGANSAERLHFLIEASVMKQFNTSFIVKLYGVVSDGQPVLVVMELMKKGNLRDYLRSRRPGAEENRDNLPIPSHSEYVRWACQIADGMAYLESLKFCHRDLAARNCMVSEDDSVKIGDFGMARDIYYHEYYKPTGKRLMPVRWMAPESLKDGKFTMKSDVWSYGIVLYEMLTLAQQPYSGISNEDVFNYIGVSRRILTRPTGCPDFWYGLMVECWKYDPRDRPDFVQILGKLISDPSIDGNFLKASFVLSLSERSDEIVVDEIFQPEEIYPLSSNDTELVMNVATQNSNNPICNWNRRYLSNFINWQRGSSDGPNNIQNFDRQMIKCEREDEL